MRVGLGIAFQVTGEHATRFDGIWLGAARALTNVAKKHGVLTMCLSLNSRGTVHRRIGGLCGILAAMVLCMVLGLGMHWYASVAMCIGALAGLATSKFVHRPRAMVLVLLGGIIVPFVTLPLWLDAYVQTACADGRYSFEVECESAFLSETLAIQTAREAIRLMGYLPEEWALVEDGRTTSPDGIRDKYLCRNALSAKRGYVVFENRRTADVRVVDLDLTGSQVTAHVSKPK